MGTPLGLQRRFTSPDIHPYDMVTWRRADALIPDYKTGGNAFYQPGVEFPEGWSQAAINIVAQKYFRGSLGTPERESSLRQLIDRVVNTITAWGDKDDYFDSEEERETFRAELTYILLTQRAAFNSPVWFNIGVPGTPQQASACFILSVDDSMPSIKDWWANEALIFQGGSGAGANLSRLRGSVEPIGGSANTSSGPLSFMQAADSAANAIKSGGKTRRAAKMVILDIDHPDVLEFIRCKAEAENMARALKLLPGFDMGFDGKHSSWLPFQNANNSVRVTDEFMRAYEEGAMWSLSARRDGEVLAEVPARELMREIAEAAWACADPGMQYDTIINDWHTTPMAGRINGSNPCSEYMHLDDSSCNLASLNLLAFDAADGDFDLDAFRHTTEIIFIAQDILVGNADYPTEGIAQVSRAFRQLGIGFANLGAMLMARGLPYDSEEGRDLAAAITAVLTGQSYLTSTWMAERLAPFTGFEADREATLKVLGKHAAAANQLEANSLLDGVVMAAHAIWSEVVERAGEYGIRNSQASVLAPTGTIGFMMDCDTTGIEPEFALIKTKQLVGGGTMRIVNQQVTRALRRLGYNDAEAEAIVAYIDANESIAGAPMRPEHLPVFATAVGEGAIHYQGHLRMMAACQPFLSGAISKTVNLPEEVTVEEVEALFVEGWRLGLKAVAIYRDNCKAAQPLSTQSKDVASPAVSVVQSRELSRQRNAKVTAFNVAGVKGFITVGEFEDGAPAEVFLNVTRQGSTLSGIADAWAMTISRALQSGVPLYALVKMYAGMRFEPAGMTDDPEIRMCTSLVDYVAKRLALNYLTAEEREALNIFSVEERKAQVAGESSGSPAIHTEVAAAPVATALDSNAPVCSLCGGMMQRAGSCFICPTDGTTSGCS